MPIILYFPEHFTEFEVNPQSPHCGPLVYRKVNKPGTPGGPLGPGVRIILLSLARPQNEPDNKMFSIYLAQKYVECYNPKLLEVVNNKKKSIQ